MKTYFNVSPVTGKASGACGYEYGNDWITVYFTSGAVYHYTVASCGAMHIETIKHLADSQSGLNTYLTRYKPAPEWRR